MRTFFMNLVIFIYIIICKITNRIQNDLKFWQNSEILTLT